MRRKLLLCLKIALLLSAFSAGLYLRLDDTEVWIQKKSLCFLDGEPLFSGFDSFLFARYVKEYSQGSYRIGETDRMRFVPDSEWGRGPKLSRRGIVYFTHFVTKLFSVSVEKFSFYGVGFVACLAIFVIYGLFSSAGLTSAGLLGSFCAVVSTIYLARTAVGRLDTDMLNLFFPFLLSLCYYWLLSLKAKRFLLAILTVVVSNMYFLWHSPSSVVVFAALFFFLLAFFLEKKSFRLKREETFLLLGLILGQLWPLIHSVQTVGQYLPFVSHEAASSLYPDIKRSVSELQRSSLKTVTEHITGSRPLLLLGLFGFILLPFQNQRLFLLLLPQLALGLLTFRVGNRFEIYLAPFVGIGLGLLVEFVSSKTSPKLRLPSELTSLALTALLILLIWSLADSSRNFTAWPKVSAPVARTMKNLREKTPKGAWIWTWWDFGYAASYLAERPVFIDGGTQFTAKTYYVARTFSSKSFREAYNTISFISERGLTGVEELLKRGESPLSIREKLSREGISRLNHDVYWLFTRTMVFQYYWISRFGNWDFSSLSGRGELLFYLGTCRVFERGLLCEKATVDLKRDLVFLSGERLYPLQKVATLMNGRVNERRAHDRGYTLEIVSDKGQIFAYLLDSLAYASNFNQMFILRQYDGRYFELVEDNFPFAVVYRVKKANEVFGERDDKK